MLWSLLLSPALACSACACGDPTLTTMGAEKPLAGRVRLNLETQARAETERPLPGQTSVAIEGLLGLGASWSPTRHLTLAATVPLKLRSYRSPDLSVDTAFGLGDAELRGRVLLWQDRPADPRHLLGLTAGTVLPTGPRVRRDGTPAPEDVQPGLGALTGTVGGWYGLFLRPWSVWASLDGRLSTPGFDGVQPGPALLGTLMGQVQPLPELGFRLSADLRQSWADRVQGTPDTTTGGWLLAASPGLVLQPATDILVYLVARLPVAQQLAGNRTEHPTGLLGLTVDLGKTAP